jgi:hypothetical protein
MALSETDRAALRAHWLGEPLPDDLADVVGDAAGRADGGRRGELRRYLDGIGAESARQTRRLVLTYSPAAVARLVELMRGDSAETARKAAVDLLRLHESSARDELAEAAARAAVDDRRLAESLTDDQVRGLLAILADAQEAPPHEEQGGDPEVV